MARGPNKQFDTAEALEQAMLLFWEKGYAATSMTELQARMQLGAKSLYDTFGDKRQLYFSAIQHYTDTVVKMLFGSLSEKKSPIKAIHAVMQTMAKMDAGRHRGCLLGVAMAQAQFSEDVDLARFLERQLGVIENALFDAFEKGKTLGELSQEVDARDMARLYTALFQGINLVSRVSKDTKLINGARRALKNGPLSQTHALDNKTPG